MINRITYPDSGVELKKLNKRYGITYGELLEVLKSMDKKHLDMDIIIYDEEGNMFWPCYDFMQAQEEFQLDGDNIEAGQPFLVMPR
jgi:hypothetical protein